MNVLYFIIFIVLYLIIGGFASGLANDGFGDDGLYWVLIWPIGLIFLILVGVVFLPMRAGEKVREWFEGEEAVTYD